MATAGRLVFIRPADGTGRLTFGDDTDVPIQPTEINLDAALDDELGSSVQLLWSPNVSRGEAIELRSRWQAGVQAAARAQAHWQPAQSIVAMTKALTQTAAPLIATAAAQWQSSQPFSARSGVSWQGGAQQRHPLRGHWQAADRLRSMLALRDQLGVIQRQQVLARYQEAVRLRQISTTRWMRAALIDHHWLRHAGHAGMPQRVAQELHWQDARRPPAGQSTAIQPPTPTDVCYDPETLGQLEFTEPWAANGRLVFFCHRPDAPAAAIVISARGLYMVQNNVVLHRVPSGVEFVASRFSLQLDADSVTFGWSASLNSAALQHLARSSLTGLIEVECSVNGVLLRLVVDQIGRDRSFPEQRVQVRGRGRSAELADGELTFTNPSARTAQQLMADVLTINGASLGWTLDWQITDWFIPADRWVFRGSALAALSDVASAAGAYIQPHNTQKVIRVLPRYPHAPWDWANLLVPDIELPAAAASFEGIEQIVRPDHNRVFIGGVKAPGIFGPVTRAGTAGDKVATPVTHPLITAAEAHIQRGRAELSDTGLQERLSLRTMVFPGVGLILPGKAIRYVDESGPRLGIVRGTNVSMDRHPVLYQTLEVETHVQ